MNLNILGDFQICISVHLNATLWHIFVEHQMGIIFMGVIAKH